MPLVFGAIADDFTGGLELASVLVRAGIRTRMLTRFSAPEDLAGVEAVVVGLKTRVAPKDPAVRAFAGAADLLAQGSPRQLFFKYCATFDSTRHGNIGPCADLLADRLGADFTAFCPAFPEVKRTVFQGHLFAFDQIISESPKRLDPLTPMRDPNLVRVLQQQTRPRVGLIRHDDFKAGAEAVCARVAALKKDGVAMRSPMAPMRTIGGTRCRHRLAADDRSRSRCYPTSGGRAGSLAGTHRRHYPESMATPQCWREAARIAPGSSSNISDARGRYCDSISPP
jgi:hypothetical protein